MDAAGTVDAENAPTVPCKTRRTRCSRLGFKDEYRLVVMERKIEFPLRVGHVLSVTNRGAQFGSIGQQVWVLLVKPASLIQLRDHAGEIANQMDHKETVSQFTVNRL